MKVYRASKANSVLEFYRMHGNFSDFKLNLEAVVKGIDEIEEHILSKFSPLISMSPKKIRKYETFS